MNNSLLISFWGLVIIFVLLRFAMDKRHLAVVPRISVAEIIIITIGHWVDGNLFIAAGLELLSAFEGKIFGANIYTSFAVAQFMGYQILRQWVFANVRRHER